VKLSLLFCLEHLVEECVVGGEGLKFVLPALYSQLIEGTD